MANDSACDRRKYPRMTTHEVISIERMNRDDVSAQAVNLSMGGICFQWDSHEVQLRELLTVTLNLEGTEVSLVGKVVRITDRGPFVQELALAFTELDAKVIELLQEYVEELRP